MKRTVWFVDDNPIFLLTATQMFKLLKCNCRLLTFSNGEMAVNYLETIKACREELPDLVLLDVNMPVMDGWAFLDYLRQADISFLSIYLLTSSIDLVDIERAKHYPNLSGYLTKPLTKEAVKNLLDTINR